MTTEGTRSWPGFWAKGPGFARARAHWAQEGDDEGGMGRRRHGGFRGPLGMAGPGFGLRWGGPGRPRPRRGDVRFAVLSLLSEQPMHGYQIITELTERSGGAWRPSPGSVYPTLQQLEDEGLVTASEEDGRRTFSLTPAGRAEVERTSVGRRAPWEELADEDGDGARALRATAMQVMGAVMQIVATGNDGQVAGAERILKEARKTLYRLLAEDGDEGHDEGAGAH
jgi:DNA-binding PadR family transcriptional regulator